MASARFDRIEELVSAAGARPLLSLVVAALAIALLLALVQSIRLARLRGAQGRAIRARAEHATVGERRAEALLRSLGFEVLARQAVATSCVYVDGAALAFEVRADLVVAKRGRTFVAEVKTGDLAPRVTTAATRRQLLEYHVVFEADGVLLVDADRGEVCEVAFGLPRA